jgi:molybdopterin converting factor small subunit
MKITVKYSGHFRDITDRKKETVELEEGKTLSHLFDALCGEYNDMSTLKGGTIYLINGEIAKKEQVLAEGDEVKLFQMMAGG